MVDAALSGECPLCHGRGWVLEADSGSGTARRCDCQQVDLGPKLMAAAGIPPRYQSCTLAKFSTAHEHRAVSQQLKEARSACEQYADSFLGEGGAFKDSGLIFVGPTGTGKTHLAAALLRSLIERYNVRGRFVEFTALVHQIQATFDPGTPGSKAAILDPIMKAELLVIDELGAQKPTLWVEDLLYLIINGRYTDRLPTIFTTNYSLDEPDRSSLDGAVAAGAKPLTDRLSGRLVSRLCEMAKPVMLDAPGDYRREILMQKRRA